MLVNHLTVMTVFTDVVNGNTAIYMACILLIEFVRSITVRLVNGIALYRLKEYLQHLEFIALI